MNVESIAERKIQPYSTEVVTTPLYEKSHLDQDADNLYLGLEQNLHLLIGGEVILPDGSILITDGFLNQAYQKLEEEIGRTNRNIEETKLRFQGLEESQRGRIRILNWVLRKSDRERDLESHKNSLLKRKSIEQEKLGAGLGRKEKEVQSFLKDKKIDVDLQENFDHMVEIEDYLSKNPNTTYFEPIQQHIESLGLSTKNLYEEFNKFSVVAQKLTPTYVRYRELMLGEDINGRHKFGLKDYHAQLANVDREYRTEVEEISISLAQAEEELMLTAQIKSYLKQQEKHKEDLYKSLTKINKIKNYFREGFLPDHRELAALKDGFLEKDILVQRLREIDLKDLELQDQVLGILGKKGSAVKENQLAQNKLTKDSSSFKDKFYNLINPLKKLTSWNVPKELKAVTKRINPRTGYATQSWDELYEEAYNPADPAAMVVREAVEILSGKRKQVVVDGVIVSNINEEVVDSKVLNKLPIAELKQNAENLTSQDVAAICPENLCRLISEGLLSPVQLSRVAADNLTIGLNEDLLKQGAGSYLLEDSILEINQSLKKSVEIAELGRRGIPKEFLPRIVIQATTEAYKFFLKWHEDLLYNPDSLKTSIEISLRSFVHAPLTLDKAYEQLKFVHGFDLMTGVTEDTGRILKLLALAKTAVSLAKTFDIELVIHQNSP